MEIKLPLEGTATAFATRDTLAFTLSEHPFDYPEEFPVKSAMLRLSIENGFAWEMHGKAWFITIYSREGSDNARGVAECVITSRA